MAWVQWFTSKSLPGHGRPKPIMSRPSLLHWHEGPTFDVVCGIPMQHLKDADATARKCAMCLKILNARKVQNA